MRGAHAITAVYAEAMLHVAQHCVVVNEKVTKVTQLLSTVMGKAGTDGFDETTMALIKNFYSEAQAAMGLPTWRARPSRRFTPSLSTCGV